MARGFGRRRRGTAGAGGASTPLQGTLAVNQATLTLSAYTLAALPATGAVAISNTAGGSLAGPTIATTYGSGSGWLTATLESTAAGWDINLSASAASLAVATYTATVTVSDANASNSGSVTTVVTFEVEAVPAVLKLQYTTMDTFDALEGATSSTPASDTITISNIGGAGSSLHGPYVESNDANWLGTAITGSGPTYTLTITPGAGLATLATGRHFGTVVVADANGGSQALTVLVDIAGAAGTPAMSSTPSSLSFATTAGAASPAAQTTTISNVGGGGSLAGPTVAVTLGSGSGWLAAAISGSGPTYTLTVTPTTTALAAGTYTAACTLSDANATQDITVNVSCFVQAATTAPVLAVSPSPSPFQWQQGQAAPASQTATISNTGTGGLAGPTATSSVSWMSPTVSSAGSGTWTLTLRPVVTGLTVGTHTGTVTVSDANAADAVTLTVSIAVTAAAAGTYLPPRFALPGGVTFNTTTGFCEGRPTGTQRTRPAHATAAATYTPANAAALVTALAASASVDNPVIELTAGVTYTGQFIIPLRTGAGQLVIRSSAHASLPASGTRVESADVANMPVLSNTASTYTLTTDGGNGRGSVWVWGVKVTTTNSFSDGLVYFGPDIVSGQVQDGSDANLATDCYLEHCWLEGTLGTVRGLQLYCERWGVYDSQIVNIYRNGQEAQAILIPRCGGYGFVDNTYLEAAGENIMVGGTGLPANERRYIPHDIYVKHCLFGTRANWNPQHASYDGNTAVHKNLFELKRGIRVLVDGCVFKEHFVDGQNGDSIVLKTSAQGELNRTENVTEDVTFHLCLYHDTPNGGWAVAGDNGYLELGPVQRIQWLDCLAFRTNISPYHVAGKAVGAAEVSNDPISVHYDHCTIAMSGGANLTRCCTIGYAADVNFRDCILPQGNYGMRASGLNEGLTSMNARWNGYTITGNALYGGSASIDYPTGNYFPATEAAVGFVNASGTAAADYALATSSTYYSTMGTDGRRIGCDVARLVTRTTGVE